MYRRSGLPEKRNKEIGKLPEVLPATKRTVAVWMKSSSSVEFACL